MVFDGVFRHNDLPGLRQLNTGLLKSAMTSDGYSLLTPCEQTTLTRFSSEVNRVFEALYVLRLLREDRPAYLALVKEASQGAKIITPNFLSVTHEKTT